MKPTLTALEQAQARYDDALADMRYAKQTGSDAAYQGTLAELAEARRALCEAKYLARHYTVTVIIGKE